MCTCLCAGKLYYYSQKTHSLLGGVSSMLGGHARQATPKATVSLLTSTIKMDDEEGQARACFRVVSPEGTYTLQVLVFVCLFVHLLLCLPPAHLPPAHLPLAHLPLGRTLCAL